MSGEQTHRSVVDLIENFLEKTANEDLASDAKSTHPSANVDDKTKPATEGSRSSENEADVRKEVPDTINDESSKNDGDSESATVNGDQGTVTMASDSGLQGNVDKPKKDHSESMEDSGPGDGSESFKGDWDKASSAGALGAAANKLMADLTLLIQGAGKQASNEEPKAEGEKKEEAKEDEGEKEAGEDLVALYKQAAAQYPEDVEAGFAAAALLAQQVGLLKDASAEEAQVAATEEVVAAMRKEAAVDAQMYIDYLRGYTEKSAQGMDEMAMADEGEAGPMEGDMGGADIGALLGGGGEAEMGGLEGAEGGMEGMEGAEGGEEEIIEALAEALDEAGVTPEDLAEAVAESTGEGGEEEELVADAGAGPEADMSAVDAAGDKAASAKGSKVAALVDRLHKKLNGTK